MTKFDKRSLICRVRVFVLLVSSGVVFIVAGVTLVIHEEKVKHNDKAVKVSKDQDSEHANLHNHQNLTVMVESLSAFSFNKVLAVIGYVFLGLGLVAICVGCPLIYEYWKRYQFVGEVENYPLISPLYHIETNRSYSSIKKKNSGKKQRSLESQASATEKQDSKSLVKEKKTIFLFRKKDIEVTPDAFRIAAHHHPAFNRVPIEDLAALSRDEIFPSVSNDNISDQSRKKSSPKLSSKSRRKTPMFGRTSSYGNLEEETRKRNEVAKTENRQETNRKNKN